MCYVLSTCSLTLIHVFAFWWASKGTQAHKAAADLLSKQWVAFPICLFNISIKRTRNGSNCHWSDLGTCSCSPYSDTTKKIIKLGGLRKQVGKKQTWEDIWGGSVWACWVKDREQISGHCFLLRETGALITDTPKQDIYHSDRSSVYGRVSVCERQKERELDLTWLGELTWSSTIFNIFSWDHTFLLIVRASQQLAFTWIEDTYQKKTLSLKNKYTFIFPTLRFPLWMCKTAAQMRKSR